MTPKSLIAVVLVLAGLVLGSDAYYVVNETEKAVLKQFGRIDKTDIKPGFYGKWPIIEKVVRVDGRTLTYDVPTQAFLTAEKKPLNVDFFIVWRVVDVERYLTVLGAGSANPSLIRGDAESRLATRVENALRDEFSARTVDEVVAGERAQVMDEVAQRVNELTIQDFGFEVVDIRVKQVDWPTEVRDRVFARMRAERNRDAAEHRARGQEEAERIRANADRQATVIRAEGYRDAQRLRGEGDAKAAAIYASAYNRDPEFFRFYRSLQAYRDSLGGGGDIMVLEPDSDFFRYLKDAGGK